MAGYRAYIIGTDGHFLRAIELICPDEDSTKEYAENLVDGHDVALIGAQGAQRWRFRRKNIIASATAGMAISAPTRMSSGEIPP
jgi:hypothetical protein